MTELLDTASVVATEAGPACPLLGALIIAHTYRLRNSAMHATRITKRALAVSLLLGALPDLWPAQYVFSREDVQLPAVQRIVEGRGPPVIVQCRAGLELHAYR